MADGRKMLLLFEKYSKKSENALHLQTESVFSYRKMIGSEN